MSYEWTIDPLSVAAVSMASAPAPLTCTARGVEVQHLAWMIRRGLAEGSVKNRRLILGRLRAYLGDVEPSGATEAQVTAFLDARRSGVQSRSGKPLGVGAYRQEVVNLREFYRWLVREGLRVDDPTARLVFPRVPLGLPRPIPDTATQDVMQAVDQDDLVIIALARLAGLRACEIARLAWQHVDLPSRSLLVQNGKGRKQREVPFGDELAEALAGLAHRTGPVVRRKDGRGGHCTDNTISRRGSAILGKAGTLHGLRHRYATALIQATGDLRTTQELLGHSSPTVTQVYTQVGSVQARRAVALIGIRDA